MKNNLAYPKEFRTRNTGVMILISGHDEYFATTEFLDLSTLKNHGNNWNVCEFANKGCVGATNPGIFNHYCSDSKIYCNEKNNRISRELN